MKKGLIYIALISVPLGLLAQETDSLKTDPEINQWDSTGNVVEKEIQSSAGLNDETEDAEKGSADADTIRIRIGDKNVEIIEKDERTRVDIYEAEEEKEDEDDVDCISDDKKKFRGHWAGLEIGINNMLDSKGSISRTPENEFMELNASRSLNVNLNAMQYSIGIVKDRLGLTTGLGLEFCNYYFSNNNTLGKNNGTIVSIDTLGILDKSKLTATYLRIPLIMEVQLFGRSRYNRLYVSAGIVGGMKLGSHTKVIYNEGDKKSKDKDDYYLNPFRWGFTAHLGYKGITLYGDYYPTPLFQTNRGPELYPFSAGLALTF